MPKFSIIIPAYNSEQYIGKGLQSIASQTFKDYELLVICDSCHDRTQEIAESYGAITHSVEFGSDGMTRDYGIEIATGEWVLFMDDDDWFLHEYVFQQLADMVGKHDEDALAFSYIWKTVGYIRQKPNELFTPSIAHVWSKCWRREAIGDARFGFARFCSDTYFLKRMEKKVKRAVVWDMPMYYYNFMREGSQTHLFVNRETFTHRECGNI